MRICFFNTTLNNSGGTERVTLVLANELVARGYEVHIICWKGGDKSFFPVDNKIIIHYIFEQENINIHTSYPYSLFKYYGLNKKIKPLIIIDVGVSLSLISLPVAFLMKIKLISWEHFNTGVNWKSFTAGLSRNLVSRFANKVIVLTRVDKQNYIERFRAKNVEDLPNPVTIKPTTISLLDSKIVLAVGRLTYQKGFDLLLQAWRLVIEKEKEWKLNIVGSGEDEMLLKQLAKDLNINEFVEFLPATKDIERVYLNTSILVMSSRFEGFPLVLLEAKSFGIPTISFNCKTGPEDIIINEVDGFLVQSGDINELALKMLDLISNESKRKLYGKNSLAVIEKYSVATFSDHWCNIFNTLCPPSK